MNENYFEIIDTKEKAYWLGFLYADGRVSTYADKFAIRISIEIHIDDEFQIERFKNAINLKKNNYYRANTVTIDFHNKKMGQDLIKHGCGPKKSTRIQLPELQKRDLNLAFLLRYFDGDGDMVTNRVSSGNRKFLKQIKKKYYIKNKIHEQHAWGTVYQMYLGASLFNEMMDNYKESIPRKRKRFWEPGDERKKLTKFSGTIEELEKVVWKRSIKEIAVNYNVKPYTILRWCKKWNIRLPPRGYWKRKNKGIAGG